MTKLERNKTIAILITVLLVGLVIFLFFYFKPKVQPQPIITFQFYQLVVMCISAFFTLSAVLVALFKDQIYAKFKYAELLIKNREDAFICENEAHSDQQVMGSPIIESYETILIVENIGNSLAEDCTFQLTALVFKTDNNTEIKEDIDVSKVKFLNWNNSEKEETLIYPKNRATVSVLKITKDEMRGPNNGQGDQSAAPILSIGGIKVNQKHMSNGVWIADFTLCSKRIDPINYKLCVEWKGSWKSRKYDLLKEQIRIKRIK